MGRIISFISLVILRGVVLSSDRRSPDIVQSESMKSRSFINIVVTMGAVYVSLRRVYEGDLLKCQD